MARSARIVHMSPQSKRKKKKKIRDKNTPRRQYNVKNNRRVNLFSQKMNEKTKASDTTTAEKWKKIEWKRRTEKNE